MIDNILNDYIKRFGIDPNEELRTKEQKTLDTNLIGLKEMPLNKIEAPDIKTELDNKLLSLNNDAAESGLDSLKSNAMKGIDAIAPAIQLVNNFKGGQFNTNPDGAEPGDAKGAVLQGAMSGAELGKALGPWGQAGGAVVGGLISTFGHKKAKKEWRENKIKDNLNESYLEKMKRKNEYNQAQGLESLENLKALRKKQYGL